jgi:hypothetical protein
MNTDGRVEKAGGIAEQREGSISSVAAAGGVAGVTAVAP